MNLGIHHATWMSSPSQYLPFLTKTAACAVFGGMIGFAIENRLLLWVDDGFPSRWLFRLRLLWEIMVTREWQHLTPLLEDNGESGGSGESPPTDSTVSCLVCHDLIYDSPHRFQTPGTWKSRGTGWYDCFIDDMSCQYPQTRDWVAAAVGGCVSCQIVVDAVSSYSPELFKDYKPGSDHLGLPSTHIRAWASPGKPLAVSICRAWIPWQSEREEYLEVFTKVGMKI